MTSARLAVFADTGYWLALANPDDGLHQKAERAAADYRSHRIVTSQLVLTEFLSGMAGLGPGKRQQAVATVHWLNNTDNVTVVPMSAEQFADAVERYGSRLDHRWSLTDCASFLIMENWGIRDALADDRDFRAAGFRPLLEDY